jgi:hypothetical protein
MLCSNLTGARGEHADKSVPVRELNLCDPLRNVRHLEKLVDGGPVLRLRGARGFYCWLTGFLTILAAV